jgi:two-component system, LytTR family, sensor kinase
MRWGTIRAMDSASNNDSPRWLWIICIWATLGVFDATQTIVSMRSQGMHHDWVRMFITETFTWVPWVLTTPFVIRLGRRYPPASLKPAVWLMHVAVIVAIAIVTGAWSALLELLLQPWRPDFETRPYLHAWASKSNDNLVPALIVYAFILAASYVLDSKARLAAQRTDAARLNEQLAAARLNALQRQIEPHFIFNTLNAVAGLVRERKNDAAVSMLVNLSDFLRKVATEFGDHEVALGQEVETLEKYLKIQEVRFAERLKLELRIPPELIRARIPSLILQPLVENAIKHGIAKRVQGGVLRVDAARVNDRLTLSVYNDGPLLDGADAAHTGTAKHGIGLANLRTRLALLYGSEFDLRLENHAGSGVSASVTLPYRES